MSVPTILVIEDDPVAQKALEISLRYQGYAVLCATDSNQAMAAIEQQRPDLVVLDMNLLDSTLNGLQDGLSLLAWMRYKFQDANFPVIINTVDDSPLLKKRAKQEKVFAVCQKEGTHRTLVDTIRKALAEKATPAKVKVGSG